MADCVPALRAWWKGVEHPESLRKVSEEYAVDTVRKAQPIHCHTAAMSLPPELNEVRADFRSGDYIASGIYDSVLPQKVLIAPNYRSAVYHNNRMELISRDEFDLLKRGQYCPFAFTRRDMIEKLPELFRTGFKTSKLWQEEREKGGLIVTNGLTIYLPETPNEDAIFMLKLGYYEGFNICDFFGLGDHGALALE